MSKLTLQPSKPSYLTEMEDGIYVTSPISTEKITKELLEYICKDYINQKDK